MKKLFSLMMAAVLCALTMTACGGSNPDGKEKVTLYVYNWGEYISDGADGTLDVIKEFEKQTGIDVVYNMYESNEVMYNKLKSGGVSYDVIIPSDYMIAKMIDEGMLEKLDFANIPNYSLIDDRFKTGEFTSFDPTCEYSVPYTWGRTGLVYNTKYVENADSWSVLWDEQYKGKTLMFDNPRDAFGVAQQLLGQSINSEDETELRAAAEKLQAQREAVSPVYVMDQTFEKMPSEEAYVAPYYLGDCLTMCDDNEDLSIAVPKEGVNLFMDSMCVPKGSQHKKEAEQFINFMCSTDIAYANIEYIAYSSPQVEAAEQHKAYLAEEYGADIANVIYPADLSGGTMFHKLSDTANQLMIDLWTEVRK